jgi:poly-gamma-glutamate capsule biosynthesis protein CapA/YwtB (metallophosphatase superfamily)
MTSFSVLAVGDVGPYRESEPERLFETCARTLEAADLVFCHLDTPYSDRGSPGVSRGTPRRGPVRALDALKTAGFDVVSFASNHGMDWGIDPFLDTLEALRRSHLVIGAGHDLDDARQPAIVELGDGTKVGFLGYCSIIMARLSGYVADIGKPGVVPLRAWTHYEPIVQHKDYTPGMPARTVTMAFPEDIEAMQHDIELLRDKVDVVIVSQHCGVTLIRAHVAMYQRQIGRAAIDAGADLVIQHHAHILRGVDFYRGKPIFYGLGDFGYEAGLSTAGTDLQPGRREFKESEELYGSLRQPGTGGYVGPEERRNTMAAKFTIGQGAVQRVSYLPAKLNAHMQASVYGQNDEIGQEVKKYIEEISREVGLDTTFTWDGDEVLVAPG